MCRRLAAELGEAVDIAILDGGEATHILQEFAQSAITGGNWLGQRTPLHATAAGKALLAYADPVIAKEVLAAELRPTRRTRSPTRRRSRRSWRRSASGDGLHRASSRSVSNALAAPVYDGTGEVVGAVGVSGPSYRLTVESFPAVAAHLLDGA